MSHEKNASTEKLENAPDASEQPVESSLPEELETVAPENTTPEESNPSSGESTPETVGESDPVAAAKAESKANYERYLRSVADLENFRRRTLREKEELRKYATSSLIEDLLPALDNLELGLLSAKHHKEGASIAQGFVMVAQQLKSILQSHGLQEIDPTGQDFDPHRHESTGQEPSDTLEDGKVLRVHRKGYLLHDRLLRPAMVILSGGSPEKQNSPEAVDAEVGSES